MSVSTDVDETPHPMDSVRELIRVHNEKGWDEAWKVQVTPWDAGTAQPALEDLIRSNVLDLPRTGRALVPGCGRGYDAICIATELGLETTGTDIAPTAIKAAQDYVQSLDKARAANVHFEIADFFAIEGESYDVVYDYTFFVAIPPARRPEWARQMVKLVKPGGFLITLVFPILPYTETGPPFYVRPEHYDALLGECWEKVLDIVPERTLESHIGKEMLVVRKRIADSM